MLNRFYRLRVATSCGIISTFMLLSGCQVWTTDYTVDAQPPVEKAVMKATSYNVDDYYEVEHEGRTYIFDDQKTYLSFLATGETPYRLTRIGAGRNGETIVFGLASSDKKKRSGIGSVMMYDGEVEGASENFYAEVFYEGRIYVFDNWKDIQSFHSVGEAPYRYTDIGAGPDGKTVVYVLNKSNKKVRPDALIAKFRAVHGL